MLLQIRQDPKWYRVEVEGRFSVERGAALDERHKMAAIKEAQEQMIAYQAKLNSHYLGEDFVVTGPFNHVEFSEESKPDLGPQSMPDPRNTRAMREHRKAELDHVARKPGQRRDLVDFVLKTGFKRRIKQLIEPIAPAFNTTPTGLIVPA